ncbi:MAG TPA: hypothetical protein VMV50_02965 [Candidatus Paceibacterota bacterium]|nr:hypothetical protein [Candidatus Paceibacterota bacterium]
MRREDKHNERKFVEQFCADFECTLAELFSAAAPSGMRQETAIAQANRFSEAPTMRLPHRVLAYMKRRRQRRAERKREAKRLATFVQREPTVRRIPAGLRPW